MQFSLSSTLVSGILICLSSVSSLVGVSVWAESVSQAQSLPIEAKVQVKEEIFELEVARTPLQQQIGLMFRDELPDHRGMVFLYTPPARPVRFWMLNTRVPLDIIFLYQGKVVYLAESVPGCPQLPCPSYGPLDDRWVDQVVELKGGTAKKLGLDVGDPLVVEFVKPE
jgi:uncharacterized membrane protein (UPF0127 family)